MYVNTTCNKSKQVIQDVYDKSSNMDDCTIFPPFWSSFLNFLASLYSSSMSSSSPDSSAGASFLAAASLVPAASASCFFCSRASQSFLRSFFSRRTSLRSLRSFLTDQATCFSAFSRRSLACCARCAAISSFLLSSSFSSARRCASRVFEV